MTVVQSLTLPQSAEVQGEEVSMLLSLKVA